MIRIIILTVLVVVVQVVVYGQTFKGKATGKEDVPTSDLAFEKEVLAIVNKIRKKRGRRPLQLHPALVRSARYHAMDMGKDNYFDHSSKDRTKGGRLKKVCSVFDRMEQFTKGTKVTVRSENIAAGDGSPKKAVDGWMRSKGHRINILDKSAKYLGVGYIEVKNSSYTRYWVQNFGL